MPCCSTKSTNAIEPVKADNSSSSSDKQIIPVNKPQNSKIIYLVTVKTGDFRNCGTNGPVYINIFGRDEKKTDDLMLLSQDKPFSQGSIRKFEVTAVDIGKPQRVIIRHEDKSTGWYIDYVEVLAHDFLVRFVANRWLNRFYNDQKLEVELFGSEQPAVLFNIEIETGNEQIESLDSAVYLQVFGTTTITPKLFLESKNTSFVKGSISKFILSSNNVGEIQRVIIGHEGLGKIKDWYLKSVKLQMLSQRKEFVANKLLSPTKGDRKLFVELTENSDRSSLAEPSIKYLVNIRTADVKQNQTAENVEIIVRGSKGKINKTSLKDCLKTKKKRVFQQGQLDEFEIEYIDIGTIESLTIGFSDSKQQIAWLLEHIDIQYKDKIYHFPVHFWLSSRLGPNFSWITVKPDANDDDIQYKIIVETGESGIDSNVLLCIFGDQSTTNNLPLNTTKDGSAAKFTADSVLEFDLHSNDVGKIEKINIGHDGKGIQQQWLLKSVHIEKNNEKYTFVADQLLSEEAGEKQTYIDLTPIGTKALLAAFDIKKDQVKYLITIVTDSDDDAGTDSNVLMKIIGDKNETEQFQLRNTKEGDKAEFKPGSKNEFEMELDDVGSIKKINIGHDNEGAHSKWQLKSVGIQKGLETYNFIANKTLDESTRFIDLTPTPTEKSPTPSLVKAETPIEEKKKPHKEETYTASIHTGFYQKDAIKDEANFYLTLIGENNQTKKIYLKDSITSDRKRCYKKDEQILLSFKADDVGKISKLIIGQDDSEHDVTWHVDNIEIKHKNESTTFNAEKTVEPNAYIELLPSTIPKKTEVIYQVFLRTGSQHDEGSNSHLSLIIIGQNGQTKKLPFNQMTRTEREKLFRKYDQIQFDFKTNDVGKISKIILSQDSNEGIIWHIENLTIRRANESTTFNVERTIDRNSQLEFKPSPLTKKSDTPRSKSSKASAFISKTAFKMKDTTYYIKVHTGDTGIDALVTLRVRGENGTISIPLLTATNNDKPFRPSASDEFEQEITDVGKIKQIVVEHDATDDITLWHLKSIEIRKGDETYNFHADLHLDFKQKKINLYPVGAFLGHKREDYVQTELRRLKESLRAESSKLRPPIHKAHKPYVYNDLGPYFDTTAVERAIYDPLDVPLGYYTRVTALRVVEPWEGYGMNYGVSYELSKQRRFRSLSSKRPIPSAKDDSIDRKQGSTHLPKYPCVSMQKPSEYSRPLTMNDVPKIRALVRSRYTAQAHTQREKDYKRTHDDLYRMELDNLEAYHKSNRENMLNAYHSYLENTPGSKKAVRELCDRVKQSTMNSSNETAA